MPSAPEKKALRGLSDRLGRSDDVFGRSVHTEGPPPADDPLEVLGRRIGRGLAVLAAIALVAYLLWPRL